jgi:dynein light intermediate chain 1
MDAGTNRHSTHTNGAGETDGRNGEHKKNLWTSMLESVASGKRLPEKNLLVLGRRNIRSFNIHDDGI